jgi:3-hexulose-6-phosphate synthase
MAQTQMALDSLDFDATVALATATAPHASSTTVSNCLKLYVLNSQTTKS